LLVHILLTEQQDFSDRFLVPPHSDFTFSSRVAFDSANGDVYVTDGGINTVSVIDGSTNQVIGNIVMGSVGGPVGVAFDSANGDVYVANTGTGTSSETISVIDGSTNQIIGTIPVSGPQQVAFDSANGDIYVTASTNTFAIVYNIFYMDFRDKHRYSYF
jgi:YVTN family beta-propeller protein